MRRIVLVLLSVLLSTTAFAQEAGLRPPLEPKFRLGRAMILRPAAPLSDADRAELAAKGISVRHVLGEGTFLARVKEGAKLQDARIASLEPMTARHKLHPTALRAAARGKKVHVVFQQDVSFADARAAVLSAGGALAEPFRLKFEASDRVTATVAPAALEALAADERVLGVIGARNWKVKSDNATSATVSRVDQVHAAPYGLTGAGVTVSLFELAQAQADHVEFPNGRFTVHALGGTSSDKAHATHVAGTIAAAGVNPQAKGMAPGARIHQFCVPGGSNDCEDRGDYGWLDIKEDDLAPLGVVADNNSWGYVLGWGSDGGIPVWNFLGEYFGAYDLIVTSPIDRISNEKNILFVHSAGNEGNVQGFSGDEFAAHRHVFIDCEVENCGTKEEGDTDTSKLYCYSKNASGTDCPTSCSGGCETVKHDPRTPYDTIGVTASAKNVLTVGALIASGSARDITGFSSRGPARDGRIKPDVVARGYGTRSSVPTNGYTTMNGTSQASPVVTGIAALLVEQWRKTFNNASPSPAQLKALIIAGAVDLGTPGPDYTYGFGLADAKNSVDTIIADGGSGNRIRSFDFANGSGQNIETTLTVTETQNLRVVLNWADPTIPWAGGDFIAAKALVNDLDLKVIDPAGNTHLPWKLDFVQQTAQATRGVNTVDNTEMLEIPNAAPGVYRIIATGSNVAQGPQKAVLVSNATLGTAVPPPPPCRDAQEIGSSNDTPATATRNIVSGALVMGGLCTATDVDYYTFTATKTGPVLITLTTKDTPVRVTLLGPNGLDVSVDVPANSTETYGSSATSVPALFTVRVATNGPNGVDSSYSFTADFGQETGKKRRSTR
jgi:hypothetical protein